MEVAGGLSEQFGLFEWGDRGGCAGGFGVGGAESEGGRNVWGEWWECGDELSGVGGSDRFVGGTVCDGDVDG